MTEDTQERGAEDPSNGASAQGTSGRGPHTIADAGAEGLRAASELLDLILERDRELPSSRAPSSNGGAEPALLDAWAGLLQRATAGLARRATDGPVTVPLFADGVCAPVRLTFDEREHGDSASAEIWLHNGTLEAAGPLRFTCGALAAPDGSVLEGTVRFEPPELEALAPRSSRGVLISFVAHGSSCPGTYRGTIQAAGAAQLWLPIEVVVTPC